MSMHYCAFISYRHAPEDIRVAVDIQRRLEHFRIPKAIRRSRNMKSLGRVFRDRDELPITSDLAESLQEALRCSDWLIVICSKRTSESMWVEREIEEFLKTHPVNRVMTVLVDGEPRDVIPAVLQEERKSEYDAQGVLHEIVTYREPLSCDYRIGMRRARREELPRLAASIIGCEYDELRQRQRQYVRRRAMTAGGLALGAMTLLTGYFFWSNLQITRSYHQAMAARSRSLAGTSGSLLEQGNSVMAARLALEGLEGSEGNTPLTSEACLALSQAVRAYTYPTSMDIGAVSSMSIPSDYIKKMAASPDLTRCAMLDYDGRVFLWDCLRGISCGVLQTDAFFTGIAEWDDESFLLTADENIRCVRYSDGAVLWEQTLEGRATALIPPRSGDETIAVITLDGLEAFGPGGGQETKQALFEEYEPVASGEWELDEYAVSTDGCYCAGPDGNIYFLVGEGDDYAVSHLLVWNTERGFFADFALREHFEHVKGITAGADGRVYAQGFVREDDYRMNVRTSYTKGTAAMGSIANGTLTTVCLDPEKKTILWSAETVYDGAEEQYFLQLSDSSFETYGAGEVLLCGCSNQLDLFEAKTGKKIRSQRFPAEICAVSSHKDLVRVMLMNGYQAFIDAGAEGADYVHCFPDHCRGVLRFSMSSGGRTRFLIWDSRRAFCYENYLGDPEWTPFDTAESPEYSYFEWMGAGEDTVVMMDDEGVIRVFDSVENREILRAKPEPEQDSFGRPEKLRFGGFSEDETLLFLEGGLRSHIYRVNLEDGSCRSLDVPLPDTKEGMSSCASPYSFRGGRVFYVTELYEPGEDAAYELFSFDPESRDLQRFALPFGGGNLPASEAPYVSGSGRYVLLPGRKADAALGGSSRSQAWLLDTASGEVTEPEFGADPAVYSFFCTDDGGEYLAVRCGDNDSIQILRGAESGVFIDLQGEEAASAAFYDGSLLVMAGDGTLRRYSLSDGSLQQSIRVSEERVNYYAGYEWHFTKDGHLMLVGNRGAAEIDFGAGGCIARARSCVGYLDKQEKLLVESGDLGRGRTLGFYPRYSVEDLREKGKVLTENLTVTPEEAALYGLETEAAETF